MPTSDMYYSLTLVLTMMGLMGAFYWYGESLKPMVENKRRAILLNEQHKDKNLSDENIYLSKIMLDTFSYKRLLILPTIHACVAIFSLILSLTYGANAYTMITTSVIAIISYMYIVHNIIKDFKAIPTHSSSIVRGVKDKNYSLCQSIMAIYPNIRIDDWFSFSYKADSPDFSHYLITQTCHKFSDEDVGLLMRDHSFNFSVSPIEMLNMYEWPERAKRSLVLMLK